MSIGVSNIEHSLPFFGFFLKQIELCFQFFYFCILPCFFQKILSRSFLNLSSQIILTLLLLVLELLFLALHLSFPFLFLVPCVYFLFLWSFFIRFFPCIYSFCCSTYFVLFLIEMVRNSLLLFTFKVFTFYGNFDVFRNTSIRFVFESCIDW